jgi:hypothetical protein
MTNNLLEMINRTITFIESPAGIFILILIAIAIVEFLVIILLIWILKHQFENKRGVTSSGTFTT